MGNDEVPIGGKSTFMVDEFPPEGDIPKKKPVVKKKQPIKKAVVTDMVENPVPGVVLDEVPVGGG